MDFPVLFVLLFMASVAGVLAGACAEQQKTIQIINQCEASLPRDQHCKLIAVSDKGE